MVAMLVVAIVVMVLYNLTIGAVWLINHRRKQSTNSPNSEKTLKD